MPKNNNRETITLGHPTLAEIKAKLDKQVDKTVRTQSEIAKLAARPGPLADLIEAETAAANAAALAKERALFGEDGGYGMQTCPECKGATQTGYVCPTCKGRQVIERSVDPGDVVGLDEFTPDSETAVNGDSKGTDPNAG